MTCAYGCKQKGIYQLKNGNRCCSKSQNSCPEIKRKCIENHRRIKLGSQSEDHKRKRVESKKKNGKKWKLSKETKGKMSKTRKGVKRGPHKEEIKQRMRKPKSKTEKMGKYIRTEQIRKKLGDLARKQCLNGHAIYMNFFVMNPSKGQVETWRNTVEVFPYSYLNFPVYRGEKKKNYSIDIAIPKLDIAIEYDGSYWHEDKKHDKKRQQDLETDGWKFLRYIDQVPTKEQVQKDILEIINDK